VVGEGDLRGPGSNGLVSWSGTSSVRLLVFPPKSNALICKRKNETDAKTVLVRDTPAFMMITASLE
jgi:hypothetical protein